MYCIHYIEKMSCMLIRQSEQRSEYQHDANHRTVEPPSRMLTERVVKVNGICVLESNVES